MRPYSALQPDPLSKHEGTPLIIAAEGRGLNGWTCMLCDRTYVLSLLPV